MPARKRKDRNVYVIELDPAVLEKKKFREANPQHDPRKPCVYVGMTALEPKERFDQHKAGIKACRYVTEFGVRLRPSNYAWLNPMTWDDAVLEEVALAGRLRRRGYAVWQH